jgi:hypothetical protein
MITHNAIGKYLHCPTIVNFADGLKMLDFILGTHPISTKGTTELGRSEATKRF